MMRQYELVERVLQYDPKADEGLLNRAYVYAMKAHGNQKRASGDPYFSHPLEVAAILTDLKLDDATIATALLHDVIEDTEATRAEIDQLFGQEIGSLVEGLTKIKRLDLVSQKAQQAENFRKLLVAISSDIRVLLVKLADRLHNMRTLEHMTPASRKRNSEETLEIYAPLAGRMGMQALREELEELAFKWLNPEAYQTVVEKLRTVRERNVGLVAEILQALQSELGEEDIVAEIKGREKKPYSIWRKMTNKQIGLELLSDIYAFRIVVDSVENCYRLLGMVHTTWRAVPGRFKDYISTPKQNGYQSLHTTVIGPRHQRVELQLRTQAMHQIAEYGVAAHALYKDAFPDARRTNGSATAGNAGGLVGAKDSEPYMWLRRLVQTLLEGDNPEEFLEHTKLELFQDQVFCFTPKGRLIALPRGATPIDFAYAVHTDIGNNCIGAAVNGRQLPLTTTLRNGDEVEVLLAKGQTPPAAWEHIAVTGKARSAIRRAARDALRKQYSELGRRLLMSAFARFNQDYSDDRLRKVLSRLQQKSVDDVHAAVGRGELPVIDVVKAIVPDAATATAGPKKRPRTRSERGDDEEGWFNIGRGMGLKFRWVGSGEADSTPTAPQPNLPLRGLKNDVPVTFEPGGAVPGDRVVGVMIPGKGIRIFQIHSPLLKEFEHARWIDVTWDLDEDAERQERFPAKLRLVTLNEPGSLAQIASVIGQSQGNIDNLCMTKRTADFTDMTIEIEVWDLRHLNEIISGIKALHVVSEVERSFD